MMTIVMTEPKIEEIEKFFKENEIPTEEFELQKGVIVNDPKKFVDSHIATLKANSGKRLFRPYTIV